MDQDEKDCEHLHIHARFTLKAYELTQGAKNFKTWFDTILKFENPDIHKHYDLTLLKESPDGENVELLEVLAHSETLTPEVLEALYFEYIMNIKNKTVSPSSNIN